MEDLLFKPCNYELLFMEDTTSEMEFVNDEFSFNHAKIVQLLLVIIWSGISWTLLRYVMDNHILQNERNDGNATKLVLTISRQFKKLLLPFLINSRTVLFITLCIPGALGCDPNDHSECHYDDDQGVCSVKNRICLCKTGFVGDNCQFSVRDKVGIIGWDAFRSVFTIIFAVLAIGSAIQFVRLKKNIGFKNINSIAIVFGLIFFGCTLRTIYFAVDPYAQSGTLSWAADRILYEIAIWPTVEIFVFLLYYRMQVYTKIVKGEYDRKNLVKCLLIGLGFLAISICFAGGGYVLRNPKRATIYVRWTLNVCYLVYLITFYAIVVSLFFSNGDLMSKVLVERFFSKETQKLKQKTLSQIQSVLKYLTLVLVMFAVCFIAYLLTEANYNFQNPYVFLIFQIVFRFLEITFYGGALWILRDAPSNLAKQQTVSLDQLEMTSIERVPSY